MSRPPVHNLLPSLLVLVAVFYFINAACLSSSDSDGSGPDPSDCGRTPSGASVELLEPADGATISGDEPGAVEVAVRVRATGLDVVPAAQTCAHGQGHFVIHAHRTAPACPPVVVDTTVQLEDAELETSLRLHPGVYQLSATFVTNFGREYFPRIADTHLITVDGTLPDAGSGPCR